VAFALLAIVLAQAGDSTVRSLVDAINESDPAASFRAISDLVDLADTRREEVEKEASRLPAFYREVLRSELKTKRELGERFGRGARIDLKGENRRLWNYVDDLNRLPGMKIDVNPYYRENLSKESLDVELKNVWPLEALVRLGDRTNFYVGGAWDSQVSLVHRGQPLFPYKPPPWFFYRNIAIPQPAPRWRKLIDFSGSPRWRAIFRISPTLGPETQVVMWKDLKVIEALGEDGKELKRAAPEETAIPGYEWTSPSGAPEEMEIAFDVGERKESKIVKLRCSVVGRVPKEWRRYVLEKLDGPDGGKVEDDEFEVTVRDPSPEDVPFVGQAPQLRIRPKRIPHAELAKVPVTVMLPGVDLVGIAASGKAKHRGAGETAVVLGSPHPDGASRPADLHGVPGHSAEVKGT